MYCVKKSGFILVIFLVNFNYVYSYDMMNISIYDFNSTNNCSNISQNYILNDKCFCTYDDNQCKINFINSFKFKSLEYNNISLFKDCNFDLYDVYEFSSKCLKCRSFYLSYDFHRNRNCNTNPIVAVYFAIFLLSFGLFIFILIIITKYCCKKDKLLNKRNLPPVYNSL